MVFKPEPKLVARLWSICTAVIFASEIPTQS
jgi:hypothetical protein